MNAIKNRILTKIGLYNQVNVNLPTGILSGYGQDELGSYLSSQFYLTYHDVNYMFKEIGTEAIVTKGNYCGTLSKRIKRYLFKKHNITLPPTLMGSMGEFISRHIDKDTSFLVDFTDKFDWKDGDFGDSGSCFWGSYRLARSIMENHGCLAIRFFDPEDPDTGLGRAWLWFYDDNTALLVNSYIHSKEDIKYTMSRVLIEALGGIYSYNKVRVGYAHEDMYINGDNGILIGESVDVDMCSLPLDDDYTCFDNYERKPCDYCGDFLPEGETGLCESCTAIKYIDNASVNFQSFLYALETTTNFDFCQFADYFTCHNYFGLAPETWSANQWKQLYLTLGTGKLNTLISRMGIELVYKLNHVELLRISDNSVELLNLFVNKLFGDQLWEFLVEVNKVPCFHQELIFYGLQFFEKGREKELLELAGDTKELKVPDYYSYGNFYEAIAFLITKGVYIQAPERHSLPKEIQALQFVYHNDHTIFQTTGLPMAYREISKVMKNTGAIPTDYAKFLEARDAFNNVCKPLCQGNTTLASVYKEYVKTFGNIDKYTVTFDYGVNPSLI